MFTPDDAEGVRRNLSGPACKMSVQSCQTLFDTGTITAIGEMPPRKGNKMAIEEARIEDWEKQVLLEGTAAKLLPGYVGKPAYFVNWW